MGDTAAAGLDDRRLPPFCYQTHAALDAIRASVPRSRRSTALAVYVTLTEHANRAGGVQARDGFGASRKDIAEDVGIGTDSLDVYVKLLVAAGVVDVERRTDGGARLPNLWRLIDPPLTGPGSPTSRAESATPSRAESARDLKEGPLEKTSPADKPPKIEKTDGRHPVMDAVARVCDVRDGSPRYREVVVAVNGSPAQPGILAQEWAMLSPPIRDEILGRPEAWPARLVRRVEMQAVEYRHRLAGATLTPGALAKWWTDHAPPAARRVDAAPPPPCPECGVGAGLHAADCSEAPSEATG